MSKKKRKKMSGRAEMPSVFFERLETAFGASAAAGIQKTFVERPTSFRVNTLRAERDDALRELRALGFSLERVPWHADAFVLKNKSKRELTDTRLYADGKLYVQSLASMAPPLVLAPQPGERVLDLTAAPGSKTSQIAAMMERRGKLVANDNNKVRFFKLKHNMEMLGVADPAPDWEFILRMEHGAALAREYPEYFDKVLLDAPCSAEARFVADVPKTYGYWSERKIKEMAYKQRQLLLAAWGALKPGGALVYSTCTFAPEENEVQVARLLERFPQEARLEDVRIDGLKTLPLMLSWKEKQFPADIKKCLRIMPTSSIEGFFIARVIKK